MKSTITDIRVVPLDTSLKCSMHRQGSENCSDGVYAIVTYDDAGSTDNNWNVCRRWYYTNPDAVEWRRTHGDGENALRVNANLAASGVVVTGDFYGNIGQVGAVGPDSKTEASLAAQRQKFHFEYLNHSLKQAEWTFRLSVWFMTGGAVVILAGAVLALVHAGNPDLSYLPLVTSLTGALITVGGGALALHSKRTMANLTKAAEDNESKIDVDHKLEVATTFIDRVQDSDAKDRLNSAAAMKALGMEATPEMMVNRLLPEQAKEIEPG